MDDKETRTASDGDEFFSNYLLDDDYDEPHSGPVVHEIVDYGDADA